MKALSEKLLYVFAALSVFVIALFVGGSNKSQGTAKGISAAGTSHTSAVSENKACYVHDQKSQEKTQPLFVGCGGFL